MYTSFYVTVIVKFWGFHVPFFSPDILRIAKLGSNISERQLTW